MAKSNFKLEDDTTATDTWDKKRIPPSGETADKNEIIIDKLDEIIELLRDLSLYEEMKSWL